MQNQETIQAAVSQLFHIRCFAPTDCPAEGTNLECRNPFRGFQGCMRLLTLDNHPVNLIKVQKRLLGNYSHLQIDMCGITDRCVPKSHTWIVFLCFFVFSAFFTSCRCLNGRQCKANMHSFKGHKSTSVVVYCLTFLTTFPHIMCCCFKVGSTDLNRIFIFHIWFRPCV